MKKNWFLYLLLLSFPLGQFARLWNSGGISILVNDLIVGVSVATWIVFKKIKKEKMIIPNLTRSILLFFAVAILSLFVNASHFSLQELFIASLYLLRWISYTGIYFVLINSKVEESRVVRGLVNAGIFISLIGLIQYFLFPDLRMLEQYGWDPHYFRLTAPFLDPTFTGAILTLSLILLVAKNFTKKGSKKTIVGGFLIYLAIALTYSRASYIMYIIGMGVIAAIKRSPKFFLAVLLLGIATLAVLPKEKSYGTNLKREETAFARIVNWKNTIMIWKDHPLFGVGFNTYRFTQRDYNFLTKDNWSKSHAGGGADSSLLFVGATTGVIGLISFLWLIIRILNHAYRKRNNFISLALFTSLIALLVHSSSANSLFYLFIMEWMWILVAASETHGE